MRALLLGLALVSAGCAAAGDVAVTTTIPASPTTAGPATTTTTTMPTGTTAPAQSSVEFVGGDRPSRLVLPPSWTATGDPLPLVVLLHGYGASGELQDVYLGISGLGAELGYLTLTPNGTTDPLGNRYWNVTGRAVPVDDVAYIGELVAEVVADHNADPTRVYLIGHSNGGFLANKIACDVPNLVAGIVAIAGGVFGGDSDCGGAVAVTFVQGTDDRTVPYAGGPLLGGTVLGAEDTVELWRTVGECGAASEQRGPFDYDIAAPGDETAITSWSDCLPGVSVELWRMEGSGHIPGFRATFRSAIMGRLLEPEGL